MKLDLGIEVDLKNGLREEFDFHANYGNLEASYGKIVWRILIHDLWDSYRSHSALGRYLRLVLLRPSEGVWFMRSL